MTNENQVRIKKTSDTKPLRKVKSKVKEKLSPLARLRAASMAVQEANSRRNAMLDAIDDWRKDCRFDMARGATFTGKTDGQYRYEPRIQKKNGGTICSKSFERYS